MTIALATPADAEAIVALLTVTYGDTYPLRHFYDPDGLRKMQAEGTLVSLVARHEGAVVGHYALKRPAGHCTAETALGMVHPEHRGGGLIDRMRTRLEDEAARLGLKGLYGHPVTAHVYSQRVYDRRGHVPTGLLLGAGEVSLTGFYEHRLEHLLTYFKYLQPPAPLLLRVPARWQALVRQIYAQLGAEVTLEEPTGTATTVSVGEFAPGRPLLTHPGEAPLEYGEVATYLDLPLQEDGWAALAALPGFVFAAVLPLRPGGERLILQRFTGDLEALAPQLNHPLSQELWKAIVSAHRA